MKLLKLIIPATLAAVALCSPQSDVSDLSERDLEWQDVTISYGRRDAAPEHEVQLAKRAKHHRRRKPKKHGRWVSTKFTWYSGYDLKNPSCQTTSRWNPSDRSMIAATTINGWPTKPKCGQFVKICSGAKGSGKCTYVRIIDSCEGCRNRHLDLSKAAFTVMKSLDVGEFTGSFSLMPAGFRPGAWSVALWGPQHL